MASSDVPPPILKQIIIVGWCIANLAGLLVFLGWSSSCCWIEPELADVPGASGGEAFVWAAGPLPMLAGFVLADLAWAMVVSSNRKKETLRSRSNTYSRAGNLDLARRGFEAKFPEREI